MSNLTALDNYNILDLLNLSEISRGRRDRILADLNRYIWEEFLYLRLNKLLTTDQLKQVSKMVKLGETSGKILDFIRSKVPNFDALYLEYTRQAKLRFMQNYILNILQDIDNKWEAQPKNVQGMLSVKAEKYHKAQELIEEGNWEELRKLGI